MLLKIIKPNQDTVRKQSSKDRSLVKLFPFMISKYLLPRHQILPKSYLITALHVVVENMSKKVVNILENHLTKTQGLQIMSFLLKF